MNPVRTVNDIKIMGIDPSTNFIGVSIFTINPEDFEITDVHTETLDLSNLRIPDSIDKHTYKNIYIHNLFTEIFNKYYINMLAIESAFINIRKISSFLPLSRVIQTIELAYYNTYKEAKIVKFAPLYVKRMMSNEFYYNKKGTEDSVKSMDFIHKFVDVSKLTEHEFDAVAITYVLYNKLKNRKEALISIW